MSEFPCNRCGACCKLVGHTVEKAKQMVAEGPVTDLVKEVAAFPHAYDTTGRCEHFTDEGTCAIYDTRPDMCNIKTMYHKYYSHLLGEEEYYEHTFAACLQLMVKTTLIP